MAYGLKASSCDPLTLSKNNRITDKVNRIGGFNFFMGVLISLIRSTIDMTYLLGLHLP